MSSSPQHGNTMPPPYNNPSTVVYTTPPHAPQHPQVVTNYIQVTQPEHKGPFDVLKSYIPAMPMCMAVSMCVLNTMIPGFGTFISAFAACCCDASEDKKNRGCCERHCINVAVAWLQLSTVFFFFFGWGWSIWWGILFITKSASVRQNSDSQQGTHTHPGVNPHPPVYPPQHTGNPQAYEPHPHRNRHEFDNPISKDRLSLPV